MDRNPDPLAEEERVREWAGRWLRLMKRFEARGSRFAHSLAAIFVAIAGTTLLAGSAWFLIGVFSQEDRNLTSVAWPLFGIGLGGLLIARVRSVWYGWRKWRQGRINNLVYMIFSSLILIIGLGLCSASIAYGEAKKSIGGLLIAAYGLYGLFDAWRRKPVHNSSIQPPASSRSQAADN